MIADLEVALAVIALAHRLAFDRGVTASETAQGLGDAVELAAYLVLKARPDAYLGFILVGDYL